LKRPAILNPKGYILSKHFFLCKISTENINEMRSEMADGATQRTADVKCRKDDK